MNKPPITNPALARIQALKAKAGTGTGRSFSSIPTAPFAEPIAPAPNEPLPEPVEVAPHAALPALEDDQDEQRVAERLIALQASGVGFVTPTNTERYNHLDGTVDRVIDSLKEIDPRSRIQRV
jgi:hypothetical protein